MNFPRPEPEGLLIPVDAITSAAALLSIFDDMMIVLEKEIDLESIFEDDTDIPEETKKIFLNEFVKFFTLSLTMLFSGPEDLRLKTSAMAEFALAVNEKAARKARERDSFNPDLN